MKGEKHIKTTQNKVDMKVFDNVSQLEKDLIMDVAAGICYCQKLVDAIKGKYDLSKVKEYKPKTKIPEIIQEVLNESNYRKSYEWQYDKTFIYDGSEIEVIRYDINTDDWCVVKIDGKEVKITKKNLKNWWEERNKKIK
jgi:hypothetical protein